MYKAARSSAPPPNMSHTVLHQQVWFCYIHTQMQKNQKQCCPQQSQYSVCITQNGALVAFRCHIFSIMFSSSCQSSTDLCDVDSVTFYGILWHAYV